MATMAILATWRITHLLQAEDGPWDILVRLRQRAGEGIWGRLPDCFYCLSLWVALAPALLVGKTWPERLLLWPALSAGAILLQRLTHPEELDIEPFYYEEPHQEGEENHGLLRQEMAGEPPGPGRNDREPETPPPSR